MQAERRHTSNTGGIAGGLVAGALLAIAASWLGVLAGGGLSSAAAGTTVNVHIVACNGAYCFQPTPADATSGDTVTFTNTTGVPHTVSRCDAADCAGQGPGTGADSFGSASTVSPGSTTSHQFSGAGTYFYYCQVHGYAVMHGVVNVAAAASPPPSSPPAATPTATARPVPSAGGAVPPTHTAQPRATSSPPTTATAAAGATSPAPLAVTIPTAAPTGSASPAAPPVNTGPAPGAIGTTPSGSPLVPILAVVAVAVALIGARVVSVRRGRPLPLP